LSINAAFYPTSSNQAKFIFALSRPGDFALKLALLFTPQPLPSSAARESEKTDGNFAQSIPIRALSPRFPVR
jgi:hypothetical protein